MPGVPDPLYVRARKALFAMIRELEIDTPRDVAGLSLD